jgi:integrase
MTLGEALNKFQKTVTPKRRAKCRKDLELMSFCATTLIYCSIDLFDFRPKDMTEFRDDYLTKAGNNTVSLYLGTISAVLNEAIKEWHIADVENVELKIKRSSTKVTERNRRLDPSFEDERRLLEATKKHRNPAMLTIIELAIVTAMRQSEIIRLTWDYIRFFEDEQGNKLGVAHLPVTKKR